MRSPVSLFEFMPYGAPELLQASRSHMTRAVAAGSGFWIAVFLLAIAIGFRASPPALELPVRVPTTIDYVELPPNYVPPESHLPVARPQPSREGLVEPVPDERVVEDPPPAPPSVIGGDKGAIVLPQGGERSEVLAPPSGLPKRDDVVYVDEYPVTILEVRPEYPSLAREAGIEGKVLVRVLVGRDGRVADAYVVPTHSIPMLDESALEAARRWVFKPALTNNHPVPVWIAIPMRFKLYW